VCDHAVIGICSGVSEIWFVNAGCVTHIVARGGV